MYNWLIGYGSRVPLLAGSRVWSSACRIWWASPRESSGSISCTDGVRAADGYRLMLGSVGFPLCSTTTNSYGLRSANLDLGRSRFTAHETLY
jgi:hypothetical protein